MLPKRLKFSVLIFVLIFGLPIVLLSQLETLTLEEAIEAAMKKNPANLQYSLIEQTADKQIEAIRKAEPAPCNMEYSVLATEREY